MRGGWHSDNGRIDFTIEFEVIAENGTAEGSGTGGRTVSIYIDDAGQLHARAFIQNADMVAPECSGANYSNADRFQTSS